MTLAHKPGSIVGIPYFKAPTDFPDSPLSKALEQPVLLGLFLPIQAGGWTNSTLPRSTGLGRSIVGAMASRLGADVVYDPAHSGTRVVITFECAAPHRPVP